MTTLHTLLLVVHVLIGAVIVALVLLQRGKGAEAGAGFGAGASGTVFGARGSANFLSRSTAVLAMLFFVTSLSLTYLGAQRKAPTSLLDTVPAEATTPVAGPQSKPPPSELPALPPSAPVSAPAPAPEVPAMPASGTAAPGKTAGQPAGPPAGQPGK